MADAEKTGSQRKGEVGGEGRWEATKPGGFHVGALEGRRWAGLILTPGPGRGLGLRLRFTSPDGTERDWEDWYWCVSEVGPHAPDGSYARVAFDLDVVPDPSSEPRESSLTVEWSRQGTGVVLRVHARRPGLIELVGDAPWDWKAQWLDGGDSWTATVGSYTVAAAFSPGTRGGTPRPDTEVQVSRSVDVDGSEPVDLRVGIAWGSDPYVEARALEAGAETILENARTSWDDRRPRGTGGWPDLVDRVSDHLLWTVLVQPDTGALYAPAGRRWIFPRVDAEAKSGELDHWTVFGWDSFFNALELGVSSGELGWAALLAGLRSQYPNGNVPNWRGRFGGTPDRSQPPVGSFAALKLHLTRPDRSALAEAYPHLLAWNEWWNSRGNDGQRRRGLSDGLLAWGSDTHLLPSSVPPWEEGASGHQRAAWESGQDDLPLWEEAEWNGDGQALAMSAVDLCSYRALDLECLARIADILGDVATATRLRREYGRLAEAMNRTLWSPEAGMYLDQLRTGLSPRHGASNFLPLIAGIPDRDRAARMVENLRDPSHYWGDWMLPTVSREDPAFSDQQYWRGSVWPPTNYLVLQGLRRYGFDEESFTLAWRGAVMFLTDCRRTGMCRENFDARTGEGRGRRFQSWGPLFALGAIEELIDVSPWHGVSVGYTPDREAPASALRTGIDRLRMADRTWEVRPEEGGYRFRAKGTPWISVRPAARLHDVRLEGDDLRARCPRPVEVTVGQRTWRPGADGTLAASMANVRADESP